MRTFAILTATALLTVIACRQNKTVESATVSESHEWPQLDSFHFVMAESFHPYADSGNLEPARKYAAEMAALAETWAGESLPEKVDDQATRALLNELARQTAAFSAMADTAPNDSLGEALTSLHDLFHLIQEAWYHESHGDEEH